jgi:hypothetical protein
VVFSFILCTQNIFNSKLHLTHQLCKLSWSNHSNNMRWRLLIMKLIICLFSLAWFFISLHFGPNVLLSTVCPNTAYFLYNFLNVSDKFITMELVIYRSVYFSLKNVDRHVIVSHWMFYSTQAGDTEKGTVGSILIEFHQSCIL